MINSNWPRWITASVAHYFEQVADGLNLPFLVNGVDTLKSRDVDHAELRVGGPFIYELSKDCYRLDVDTIIILTDLMGGSREDPFAITRWAGVFQQSAWEPIPVYRFGPDVTGVDDSSLLGCLLPRGRGTSTNVSNFGQVDFDKRVRQLSIDTRHRLEI